MRTVFKVIPVFFLAVWGVFISFYFLRKNLYVPEQDIKKQYYRK